jgi:hypothetical protein
MERVCYCRWERLQPHDWMSRDALAGRPRKSGGLSLPPLKPASPAGKEGEAPSFACRVGAQVRSLIAAAVALAP